MSKKDYNIDDDYVEVDSSEDTVTPEDTNLDEDLEAIKRFTDDDDDEDEDDEEEDDEFEQISFKSILGGDILQSKFVLTKILFIVFCVGLMLIYTGNRYGSLQDIITIDSLTNTLNKVHYETMTQSSELLNLSRQSNVERKLSEFGDTMMLNNNTPPFALPQEDD